MLNLLHVLKRLRHDLINITFGKLAPSVLVKSCSWLSWEVLALVCEWNDVFLPSTLAEEWHDWVHDGEESLKVGVDDNWVDLVIGGDGVCLLERVELVEENNNVLDLHTSVALSCLFGDSSCLIKNDLIPLAELSIIIGSEVDTISWDVLLDPLFEDEQLKDGSISDSRVEVSVIKTISTVSKGESGGINSVFVDALVYSHEVTSGL